MSGLQVQLEVQADRPQHLRGAELAACEDKSQCSSKVVQFDFQFLDPNAIRATTFLPMSEFVYGGTKMLLKINNLPENVNASDVLVEFHINASVISIVNDHAKSAQLEVIIPRCTVSCSRKVKPRVYLLGLRLVLNFDTEFKYRPAPLPRVVKVLPSTAMIDTESRIRISMTNFPLVESASDVKVRFEWTNGQRATAQVLSHRGPQSQRAAMQNIEVDVLSPLGMLEGSARIIVFHQKFGETIAAVLDVEGSTGVPGFKFIDPQSPQMSRITGADGTMGVDEIQIPMSGSEVTIIVDDVPREAVVPPYTYSVLVGGIEQDIKLAETDDEMRQGLIVFSIFPQSTAGVQEGTVMFGEGVAVTFKLVFFDDSLPMVTALSDLTGPETGGDLVKLHITNFPVLLSEDDVLVSFQIGDAGDKVFVDTVVVLYSDDEKTELLIVTPAFAGIEQDQTLDFTIELSANSRKSVSFSYMVQSVQPVVNSFFPVAGLATGGQTVVVTIDYFEFPTRVKVLFGESLVADDDIEIMPMSSIILTVLKFTTPNTNPGVYTVTVSPKTCPDPCSQAVRFSYEQLDATLPELVQPVPTGTSFQRDTLPAVLFVASSLPPVADIAEVLVEFVSDSDAKSSVISYSKEGDLLTDVSPGIKKLTISKEKGSKWPDGMERIATFQVFISFVLTSGLKKEVEPFGFSMNDGTQPRVVEMVPSRLPTSGIIGGRKLGLQSTVRIVCANLQGDTDLSALLSGALPAELVQQRTLVDKCPGQDQYDCTRTLLVFKMPAVESPGDQQLTIYKGTDVIVTTSVEFVPPCNYDAFCQSLGLVVALQQLVSKPELECSAEYCLDPALIGDPSVDSFSPRYGSKRGGTEVTVKFRNVPAWGTDDLTVHVEGSVTKTRAIVTFLQQRPTSTLISSEGVLRFTMPQFTDPDEFAQVSIVVMVAGTTKTVSFDFEYLPVITGAAELQQHSPTQIFEGEDLELSVKVTNIPRLSFPFRPQDMIVQVAGTVSPVTVLPEDVRIVSSDRYSTALRVSVNNSVLQKLSYAGSIEVFVGARSQGATAVGSAVVEVLQVPEPALLSSYPAHDVGVPSNVNVTVSVKVAYLDENDLSPSLNCYLLLIDKEYQVDVIGVKRMMDKSCAGRFCSLAELLLAMPALPPEDQNLGQQAEVHVFAL